MKKKTVRAEAAWSVKNLEVSVLLLLDVQVEMPLSWDGYLT